jgi:hypothetical protein
MTFFGTTTGLVNAFETALMLSVFGMCLASRLECVGLLTGLSGDWRNISMTQELKVWWKMAMSEAIIEMDKRIARTKSPEALHDLYMRREIYIMAKGMEV